MCRGRRGLDGMDAVCAESAELGGMAASEGMWVRPCYWGLVAEVAFGISEVRASIVLRLRGVVDLAGCV